ncbi:MAG: DUF3817 domain-containing protein [Chitinophagaceae bacterium]
MKKQHPVISRLRFLGYAEAFSWVVLIVAMCFKYIWHLPAMVTYTGWFHGVLFLLYSLHLVLAQRLLRWTFSKLLLGGVSAFLPFGTLWFDRYITPTEAV